MIRSAVLIQSTRVTDGQTDGIGVAYTHYSTYAVACIKMDHLCRDAIYLETHTHGVV